MTSSQLGGIYTSCRYKPAAWQAPSGEVFILAGKYTPTAWQAPSWEVFILAAGIHQMPDKLPVGRYSYYLQVYTSCLTSSQLGGIHTSWQVYTSMMVYSQLGGIHASWQVYTSMNACSQLGGIHTSCRYTSA